jgi:hypothetical protein
MPARGVFYGAVAVFVALLILSGTLAAYYYGQYQQATSQNQRYASELSTALDSYRTLSGSYNASLSDYNRTLTLLAAAVANLNTTTPAYRNASVALSSLWSSYQQLAAASGRRALVYGVHLILNFGNGTRRWYNDSTAQPGWNGYVVSLVLLKGNVQATWYPQYGEHFVTGLDGIPQTTSESWFVWEFSGGGWTVSQSGADQIPIDNGTVLAWTFCGYDASYNPTCSP